MAKSKSVRSKGKLELSRYFQKFEKGDKVSVVKEISIPADFPERLQGRTGVVDGMQGRSIILKIKDQAKEKTFLIAPVHLKKIKNPQIK
jgi:ribosomal protein L21E